MKNKNKVQQIISSISLRNRSKHIQSNRLIASIDLSTDHIKTSSSSQAASQQQIIQSYDDLSKFKQQNNSQLKEEKLSSSIKKSCLDLPTKNIQSQKMHCNTSKSPQQERFHMQKPITERFIQINRENHSNNNRYQFKQQQQKYNLQQTKSNERKFLSHTAMFEEDDQPQSRKQQNNNKINNKSKQFQKTMQRMNPNSRPSSVAKNISKDHKRSISFQDKSMLISSKMFQTQQFESKKNQNDQYFELSQIKAFANNLLQQIRTNQIDLQKIDQEASPSMQYLQEFKLFAQSLVEMLNIQQKEMHLKTQKQLEQENSKRICELQQNFQIEINKQTQKTNKFRQAVIRQKALIAEAVEKEDKVMSLIYAIGKRGIDIEKIYQEEQEQKQQRLNLKDLENIMEERESVASDVQYISSNKKSQHRLGYQGKENMNRQIQHDQIQKYKHFN